MAITGAAAAAVWAGGRPASATTYVWNNTGNAWETGSDWTPTGPPTAADIASFDPTVSAPTVMNPTINNADAALTLALDDNFLGGTYDFGGAGTLTLGTGGVVVRGFGTQVFAGPTLAGAATGNLAFNVGTSSGLILGGATTATTNAGAVILNGGTLTLDNSTSATLHLGVASVPNFVGGTLAINGNAAGTAYTLGAAAFNAGFNTVSLNATNGSTSVNLNNGTAGVGVSLRTQTFMVEQFVSTSGTLGTAAGGVASFTGTPFSGANGLLASSSGGGTVGFATVRDTTGTNFAVYTTPSGGTGGIVAATPTQTTSAGSTLQTYAGTDRVQYNPAAAAADTASSTVTNGSLRITPAGAGASLSLGANNLATNALMLDGTNNFTIAATPTFNSSGGTTGGGLGATGTRYIYVNNAATTLTTSVVIANSTNPTNIAGPGFVTLNGTTSQNTLSGTNRLTLLGGVLRGNTTQLGFGATGGAGFLNFRGGVLEITSGTNGTGTAADYTRPLATTATAGATNWSTSGTDQGSGGFSSLGAAASVNIGGSATPAALTWNTGGFVNDGYALRFGSTQSNAILTFQNPVALDAGTAGLAYTAREVSVTAGTGGDKTVFSGVVSGSAQSDLLKTGTGTLQLSAANTYAGRTLIEGGTVAATTLAGPVVLTAAGTETAGTGPTATDTIGTLTTPATQNWVAGGTYAVKVNAATAGASVAGSSDELVFSGLGNGSSGLTINPVQTTAGGTFATGATASFVIADATASATAFNAILNSIVVNQTANTGTYSVSTAADGTGGEDLILNLTAAPEPTSLLLMATAAAPLVLGRRRRDRATV